MVNGNITSVSATPKEHGSRCLTLEVAKELPKICDVQASISRNNYNQVSFCVDLLGGGKVVERLQSWDKKNIEDAVFTLFLGKSTNIDGTNKDMIYSSNLLSIKPTGEKYSYDCLEIYHMGDLWFSYERGAFKLLGRRIRTNFGGCEFGIIGVKRDGEILLRKIEKDNINLDKSYITLPGKDMSQINESNLEFLVVSEGKILRCFLECTPSTFKESNTPIQYKSEGPYSFRGFGDIQAVDRDINKNFVLVVGKKGDKYTLYVLRGDRWTDGEVLTKIEGVMNFITMEDGSLLGIMEDGKVRSIATTFSQFKEGYFKDGGNVEAGEGSVKTVQDSVHKKMLEAMDSVTLKGGDGQIDAEGLDVSEQDVISKFWSKSVEGENKTIKDLFEEAKTPEEIRRVERLVNKILVSISSFQGVLAIKNYIKDIIIRKKEEIILHDFQEEVNSTEDALNKADNFQELIKVKTLIENLHERKKSLGGGIELGKKIQEMRKSVEKKITEYQEEGREDILSQIQKNIEELKLYINAISYGSDLTQIYNLYIWKQTMDLLEYLDDEEKKKQKKSLLELVSKKSSEIVNEEKKESEKKELEIQRRINEINDKIDILIEMLETVHTIEAVNEKKQTDPFAKEIEKEIKELPPSIKGELEIKYEKAFKDRIFHIRRENVKEKGIVQNLDDSGIDTMLYYVDTEKKDVSWKLKGEPTAQGLIKLGISIDDGKRQYTGDNFFEDSDKFADLLIGDDIEFEITKSEYVKLNRQLDTWRKNGKDEVNKLVQELCNVNWKKREPPFDGLKFKYIIKMNGDSDDGIEAKNLVEGLPDNAIVEFKDGKGVDNNNGGEKQKITLIVKVGEKQQEITVIVTIDTKKKEMRVVEKEQNEILEEIMKLKSQYKKARYVEKLANRLIKKERLNPRSHVPEVDHNYIVLDEEKESLKALSGSLLYQKKHGGITILEGGPGLGKTVMCEYLAAVTNREIIRVQCSKKISYSEFFFAPTLKKGETSRNPAEWIKMMQNPGTVILFDEIDKLNAECMAGLHALFESRRHVHDPQLGDFYANPDCLFLGTMNSYDPLPKAIASRATIQRIDYPSEINEAYKISKYVDNDFLNSLNYEEFKEIRANQGNRSSKSSKEHKINEILDNIGKLLQVFKLLRDKYYGEYEKFEYELSYRDAAQIFSAYSISNNFKKAVSDILLSKASSVVGTMDQKEQKGIVLEVIEKVF